MFAPLAPAWVSLVRFQWGREGVRSAGDLVVSMTHLIRVCRLGGQPRGGDGAQGGPVTTTRPLRGGRQAGRQGRAHFLSTHHDSWLFTLG